MDWVVLSFAAALAFTAYSVIQKRVLDRYVDGAVTFAALSCIPHGLIAGVILLADPPDWFSWPVLAMAMAGTSHAAIQLLSGYAFRREADISRIVPIMDAFPLFVLVMAIVFLGEALTPLKAGAALLVTGGVMVASWHQSLPGARIRLNRSLVVILGAAFAMATYSVLAKAATGQMSIMQMYAVSWMFSIPWLMGTSLLRNPSGLHTALTSRPALVSTGVAQAIILFAFVVALKAFELGPVSLSSAVMSTRPVLLLFWVVASGMSVRAVLDRRTSSSQGRARWASAALVTTGVGAMAF
ncbi:MAG: EamA family transporter [Chloroflexota bacterium]|nr:EamA family transporter [Chloroflexota bacterium]MDE2884432.1 EamA family transporter [Chloroflexota bacterium]